jgi:2-polyprenyl-6-methoxyphenol hydroxylase-like FAD-dependent oxidoreductase
MIGAHTLAEALACHNRDHTLAFREYEVQHRRMVEPKQRWMTMGASLLVPRSSRGIAMRNTALRLAPSLPQLNGCGARALRPRQRPSQTATRNTGITPEYERWDQDSDWT